MKIHKADEEAKNEEDRPKEHQVNADKADESDSSSDFLGLPKGKDEEAHKGKEASPDPVSSDDGDFLACPEPVRKAGADEGEDEDNGDDFLDLAAAKAPSPPSSGDDGDFLSLAPAPQPAPEPTEDKPPARKKSRYEILAGAREAKARLEKEDVKQRAGRLAVSGTVAMGLGPAKWSLLSSLAAGRNSNWACACGIAS